MKLLPGNLNLGLTPPFHKNFTCGVTIRLKMRDSISLVVTYESL